MGQKKLPKARRKAPEIRPLRILAVSISNWKTVACGKEFGRSKKIPARNGFP
jgi:hypothetical protein